MITESSKQKLVDAPEVRADAYYAYRPDLIQAEDVDLVALVRNLLAHRRLIACVTLCCMSIALLVAFLMTPVYKAEVLLSPVSERDGSGKLQSLLGGMGLGFASNLIGGQGDSKVELALATLKSRAFLYSFIEEYDLLPILFAKQWDANKQAWNTKNMEEIPTLFKGYELFSETILNILQDKKTGLITLSVEWEDPALAALWANALVQRLNDQMRSKAIIEYEKQNEYLSQEIQKTSVVHVQEAMFNLIESQTKEAMLANVTEEFALKVIDPAMVPEERSKPNRKLIVASGLFLGLFLGCLLVFAKDFKNQLIPLG